MLISPVYVDVAFPLNLGPLTYSAGSLEGVAPGALVTAEIKKTLRRGVVLGPSAAPPGGPAKEIASVEGPFLSTAMLGLLRWMSDYYLVNEGSVLKGMFPREFFEGAKPRGGGKEIRARGLDEGEGVDAAALGAVRENAGKKYYRTFLLHAPSSDYELRFALEAARGMRNVIVLCPEHAETRHLAGALAQEFGDRLAVLQSGISRGRRAETVKRIAQGRCDIVLGSRSAVFAPLAEVSLIVVIREEDPSYKEEGGVLYNARDMAVMRGYLEGASVVLSSICPSVESYHNASTGKYTLLSPPARAPRPAVRLMDMRGSRRWVSPRLLQSARRRLERGERVMFLVNRKGYSILECADCSEVPLCPECRIPLVFHKKEKALRCRYCGLTQPAPGGCPSCGGLLDASGAGLERVEEELASLNPVGVDLKRKASALKVLTDTQAGLAVGTKILSRAPELRGGFSLAAVLNADAYLFRPDFRSTERAFQDLLYAAQRVRAGGELVLQVRNPGAPLFRYVRRFDFARFYAEELRARKELSYPPFSRMALLTAEGPAPPPADCPRREGVEVLGPVQALTKRGKKVWKVLVKAPTSRDLRSAVRHLLKKGAFASVDVDPISM
ncbi:MAG: hypothetical protein Kow0025_24940 [Thermodesulfovibrionales bacterium]